MESLFVAPIALPETDKFELESMSSVSQLFQPRSQTVPEPVSTIPPEAEAERQTDSVGEIQPKGSPAIDLSSRPVAVLQDNETHQEEDRPVDVKQNEPETSRTAKLPILLSKVSTDWSELVVLIDPYVWWAKCNAAFCQDAKKRGLWAKVVGLLDDERISLTVEENCLSVIHLLKLARHGESGDPFQIVDYLRRLAIYWRLQKVADEYFNRYRLVYSLLKE